MKRILPAMVLALLIHAVVFRMDARWAMDEAITMPKARCVTVTMSYRQPQKAMQVKKKKTVKPQKPKPEPTPKKEIVKLEEKIKPLEDKKQPVPEPEVKELVEDAENTDDLESSSHGDSISNMQVTAEATPLYKKNSPPRYPKVARKRGYQGTVLLSVLVDEIGQVANLFVFTSSGFMALDNAAIKAVKHWAFEPGTKGGQPTQMWVKIPVRFELK